MRWVLVGNALLLAASTSLVGCGGVYYAATVNAAETRLEEARALGAAESAPYEYYYAHEHLEKARIEAAEASYGDAVQHAKVAEEYAEKAVTAAKSSKEKP